MSGSGRYKIQDELGTWIEMIREISFETADFMIVEVVRGPEVVGEPRYTVRHEDSELTFGGLKKLEAIELAHRWARGEEIYEILEDLDQQERVQ